MKRPYQHVTMSLASLLAAGTAPAHTCHPEESPEPAPACSRAALTQDLEGSNVWGSSLRQFVDQRIAYLRGVCPGLDWATIAEVGAEIARHDLATLYGTTNVQYLDGVHALTLKAATLANATCHDSGNTEPSCTMSTACDIGGQFSLTCEPYRAD